MTTAALYARYSTDRQDARSIDDQLRRCKASAAAHGYEVVGEFKDAAQSGASLNRADLQRLIAEARNGKGCRFRAVLVDDLSRLSRDLGDTWQLVFGTLAAANIRVIDCTTGMASDAAGARLTFGALALVNDTFLQLVRTETHRGLEGRARAGFWAGGSCYGFRTVPEPNPQDPSRPRAKVVIHEPEAEVVRRIFRDYATGMSLGDLIKALNTERVPAPADGKPHKAIRGWSKSLLFFVLRNERYVGQMVWNKRQWFRDPITKRRRYRERPESEWIRTEQPELAIIDRETWDRVHARNEENARASGKPGRTGYMDHMLSGLLRCGTCGSPLTIVSRSGKNGLRWSNYGCGARHAKGETACSNRRTVSELRVNRAVLGALMEFVQSSDFTAWVEDAIRATEEAQTQPDDGGLRRLEVAVRTQEARVEKVASTLLEVGASEFLKAKLRQEEEKLREMRQALVTAATPKRVARPLPKITVHQVLAVLDDVGRIASEAPRQARDVLATVIEPVVLRPTPEGYEAEIRLRSRTAALASGRPVFDAVGCGGRI